MGVLHNFLKHIFLTPPRSKNVALVLGGGGARGFAHIGAIEALLERGYTIHAVSGTSMGALVGGFFAVGKLQELKSIILDMSKTEMMSLMDVSLGLDHVFSGEKLMNLFDEIIGVARIEYLPIKFCCSASDLVTGKEYVFREGMLKTAIRASISIPCIFKPVTLGDKILVDGSVHNTLPLNRVERTKDDILVAVNVSASEEEPFSLYAHKDPKSQGDIKKIVKRIFPFLKINYSDNTFNIAWRVSRMSIANNTQMAMQLTPPDICVEMAMDKYSMFDYDKTHQIIEYGYQEMNRMLDQYEMHI